MVWFHVDDGLAFHKKTLEAGNGAMGLWVRAGAWATGSLTDGFIPSAIARSIGTQTQVVSLLNSGLWSRVNGGFQFHDWDHRQFSKDEINTRRESDRQRKREQRKRRNVPPGQPPDVTGDDRPDSERTPDGVTPENAVEASRPARALTPPHPTPPLKSGSFGLLTHGEYDPKNPPPENCPRHPDGTHDPCRACGAARQQHETWNTQHANHESERRATFRAELAECTECDNNGFTDNGNHVTRCPNHDWEHTNV